jgi:Flp pilus assembly protein TadG
MFPVLLAFAGLVVDAGTKLDDYQNAAAYAQEAARAGADQINLSQAYSSSRFVINQGSAIAAARAYLAAIPDAARVSGTVTPLGANSIRVTVTVTSPTRILSIIGIDSVSSTSTATATLVSGVTGAGA